MTRKPIIISVSLILVVGVVIGAVLVNRNGHTSDDKNLSTNIKAVDIICGSTTFKDKCVSTIAPVAAANSSAGLKDYLRAALAATLEEVKLGIEMSGAMNNDSVQRIDKMCLEDCQGNLRFALKDLQEALTMLEGNELNGIHDEVNEFRNWLTAVYAFQTLCLEEIEDPDLKAGLQMGLQSLNLLSNNAVDIFAKLSTILVALNIPLKKNPVPNHHRKLFDHVGHVDEHGYPHWISEGDRRLLLGELPSPNVIVAQDGSGRFKTITEALASYPKTKLVEGSRYVIYVKAGIYKEESLKVSIENLNVFMYGDGPEKTIITGDKSKKLSGTDTDRTASFTVVGNGFLAKSMGFRNTADPKGEQAVALQVEADAVGIFNCRIEGYQDTLWAKAHRQFYRDCVIIGTIDLVFGMSSTLIQNSIIQVRKPLPGQKNMVAADGSPIVNLHSGLVFQNCTFTPDKYLLAEKSNISTFLARPWKNCSTAVFMENTIEDFIHPEGFAIFNDKTPNNDLCFFAEYANRGAGAKTDRRVNWPKCHKVFTKKDDVSMFTLVPFIDGDKWLRSTGIPFTPGLTNAR